MSEEPYYLRYDDRYRRMHEKGFERWVHDPEEAVAVLSQIDTFFQTAECIPSETSVIEFGCGEGFVAEHLLRKGYSYIGLDISESAIEKAREHTGKLGERAFLVADIVTGLEQIPEHSHDIAIDNQCLHMLVTDDHRKAYLSAMHRVLKPGGKVFFREVYREEGFDKNIRDFSDWMAKNDDNDYATPHEYYAWKNGEQYTVELPRVPARCNNETGYRRELEEAGFEIEYFTTVGPEAWQCIIYAAATK